MREYQVFMSTMEDQPRQWQMGVIDMSTKGYNVSLSLCQKLETTARQLGFESPSHPFPHTHN